MEKRGLNSKKIIEKIAMKSGDIKKHGVRKIGLFGSYLKGTQKKGSDIDILVEFEKVTFNNYFELWRLLENILKRKIDLVIEKDLKPELNYVIGEANYVKI